MKKIIEEFICDDCGNKMPGEFVSVTPDGETVYNYDKYNRVAVTPSLGKSYTINIPLVVEGEYTKPLEDLCPACRLKWLKFVVAKLEKDAEKDAESDLTSVF